MLKKKLTKIIRQPILNPETILGPVINPKTVRGLILNPKTICGDSHKKTF